VDFRNPFVIEIPPMVVHWVKNIDPQVFIMVSFSNRDYNEQQPDIFKVNYKTI